MFFFSIVIYSGAKNSIWLKGDLPAQIAQETILEANIASSEGNVYDPWNVTARKCKNDEGEYFVYYLQPVPGCPVVYCAGI